MLKNYQRIARSLTWRMLALRMLALCPWCFIAGSWIPGSWAATPGGGPEGARAGAGGEPRRAYKLDLRERFLPEDRDHPLVPALQIAHESIRYVDQHVRDYTCRLVARERVSGKLKSHEYMFLKVRQPQTDANHKLTVPFSVYINFLGPKSLQGREILYVEGQNNGELLARNGGTGNLQDVTLSLSPDSPRAMRDYRYPLTEIGIRMMGQRLLEVGYESLQADRQRRECEVQIREGAKIDGRDCRVIQVRFPVQREELRFHLARIFVDQKLPLPLRYESYGWPAANGQPPPLREEYT
nr:DUF1571 domain-containing protein [Planctomycetales bacterium]NIM09196.1 DUF1571 domain-containing protein [Planctomycetales bacterium]NIN08672.1 DUF1571 domain-containing protein [Planctomycetales bacterium]NIN77791.1 DUF1571 domain-containing protein [Planctomycetales bacterium]NIO34968.1 DUF1571 domain-containing protein [Planctomycetales bacterium]